MPMPSQVRRGLQGGGHELAYHNHNLEFRKIGDVLPYDLLLKEPIRRWSAWRWTSVGWWRAAPTRSPI